MNLFGLHVRDQEGWWLFAFPGSQLTVELFNMESNGTPNKFPHVSGGGAIQSGDTSGGFLTTEIKIIKITKWVENMFQIQVEDNMFC